MPPHLIIRGGLVFDGTGAPPVEADVAVSGGRIAEVGRIGVRAPVEIDARGLNVAPGFIDIHSHSDYTLIVDPRAVSAVHQGVTTEVVGNCGHGCFPIRDRALSSRIIYGYDGQVPIDWSTPAALPGTPGTLTAGGERHDAGAERPTAAGCRRAGGPPG